MQRFPSVLATVRQFGRYGFAGGVSALTHLAVLTMLVEFGGAEKNLSSAIGFLCAIPVNYLLQHRVVFFRHGQHGRYFARYLTVTLTGLCLNSALFLLGVKVFGFHYLPTQIVVIGMIFVANFFINRDFTFSEKGPAAHQIGGHSLGSRGGHR